ncbi:hypothetical protein ACFV2N_48285 [Streptomyces sp. NPDC059680]|uniref:hypothetical protein n=1 Tax=Streptomyces sp. NPDC059680 TaxID=3346904 RepID=UPI00369FEC0E
MRSPKVPATTPGRCFITSKGWRVHDATSRDGIHFADHGELQALYPLAGYDDCGVTNSGWASTKGSDQRLNVRRDGELPLLHKLGVALPQAEVTLFTGEVAHAERQAVSATAQHIVTDQYAKSTGS